MNLDVYSRKYVSLYFTFTFVILYVLPGELRNVLKHFHEWIVLDRSSFGQETTDSSDLIYFARFFNLICLHQHWGESDSSPCWGLLKSIGEVRRRRLPGGLGGQHLPPSSNSHHTSMVPFICFFLNWALASISLSFILATWGGGMLTDTETGREKKK